MNGIVVDWSLSSPMQRLEERRQTCGNFDRRWRNREKIQRKGKVLGRVPDLRGDQAVEGLRRFGVGRRCRRLVGNDGAEVESLVLMRNV